MSSPKSPRHKSPPLIRIQSASPGIPDEPPPPPRSESNNDDDNHSNPPERPGLAPRRTRSLPVGTRPSHRRHKRKRSSTEAASSSSSLSLGIDMAGSSRRSSGSSSGSGSGSVSSSRKSSRSSTASKKSKSGGGGGSEDLDWTDVTDPEERRRIQNRIAQRKFREKQKDNKERAERESRNRQHAGNSYRIPSPGDFSSEEVSGLPWGSVNFGHFMARGQEAAAASRRSSSRGTHIKEEPYGVAPPVTTTAATATYGMPWAQQSASYGGEDVYYEDAYLYDPTRGQGP